MNILSWIREQLRGRKTYGIGIIAILLGLYIGETEGKELIVMGLGFMTLKAGQTTANETQTTEIENTVETPIDTTGIGGENLQ